MEKTRIDISKENHELLKKTASRRGISMFELANTVLQEFGFADRDEKIILTVPASLTKRNKDGLQQWLQSRMEAIMKAYYPE